MSSVKQQVLGAGVALFDKSENHDVSLTHTAGALAFPSKRILTVSNEPVHRRRILFRRDLSLVRCAQGNPKLL